MSEAGRLGGGGVRPSPDFGPALTARPFPQIFGPHVIIPPQIFRPCDIPGDESLNPTVN